MKPSPLTLPALLLVLCSFFFLPPAVLATDTCTETMEAKCTACHYLSRVCEKLGKKNASRWKRTISRMEKHGATLSKAQKKFLLSCLTGEEKGAREACGK